MEAGGLRVLEFKIQGCSEVVEEKVSSNCVELSRKKQLTNFLIEGAEDARNGEDGMLDQCGHFE